MLICLVGHQKPAHLGVVLPANKMAPQLQAKSRWYALNHHFPTCILTQTPHKHLVDIDNKWRHTLVADRPCCWPHWHWPWLPFALLQPLLLLRPPHRPSFSDVAWQQQTVISSKIAPLYRLLIFLNMSAAAVLLQRPLALPPSLLLPLLLLLGIRTRIMA